MVENSINRGDRIRNLRIQKGLTQVELGNRLGVSDTHISKWENGDGISRRYLIKLAEELETTTNYIKYGKKSEKRVEEKGTIYEKASRIGALSRGEDISDKDRDELIELLQSRANTLSQELREFSLMIGFLKKGEGHEN